MKYLGWATVLATVFTATLTSSGVRSEPIQGAGSTFAAPVIAKWSKSFQDVRADGGDFISPDWKVDYEPVGSLAGVMRLRQPELDFAATDAPLPSAEISRRGYLQFPIVVGGVAISTNIPGILDGQLKLTGAVLADIYLGKLQNWSDTAIKDLNPDVKLPDLRISVIHRKDGSGTTFTFTEYLSAVSPEWKAKYGADTSIVWPLGTSGVGTQGVVQAAKANMGAISYIEFGQASRAGLPVARIGNRNGEFIKPDAESLAAAATAGEWKSSEHFFRSLVDQAAPKVYPITASTFVIIPRDRGFSRVRRVQDVFDVAFEKGGSDATALGLIPMPPSVVQSIKQYWAQPPRIGG